jgi:hypothetical protein
MLQVNSPQLSVVGGGVCGGGGGGDGGSSLSSSAIISVHKYFSRTNVRRNGGGERLSALAVAAAVTRELQEGSRLLGGQQPYP